MYKLQIAVRRCNGATRRGRVQEERSGAYGTRRGVHNSSINYRDIDHHLVHLLITLTHRFQERPAPACHFMFRSLSFSFSSTERVRLAFSLRSVDRMIYSLRTAVVHLHMHVVPPSPTFPAFQTFHAVIYGVSALPTITLWIRAVILHSTLTGWFFICIR